MFYTSFLRIIHLGSKRVLRDIVGVCVRLVFSFFSILIIVGVLSTVQQSFFVFYIFSAGILLASLLVLYFFPQRFCYCNSKEKKFLNCVFFYAVTYIGGAFFIAHTIDYLMTTLFHASFFFSPLANFPLLQEFLDTFAPAALAHLIISIFFVIGGISLVLYLAKKLAERSAVHNAQMLFTLVGVCILRAIFKIFPIGDAVGYITSFSIVQDIATYILGAPVLYYITCMFRGERTADTKTLKGEIVQ